MRIVIVDLTSYLDPRYRLRGHTRRRSSCHGCHVPSPVSKLGGSSRKDVSVGVAHHGLYYLCSSSVSNEHLFVFFFFVFTHIARNVYIAIREVLASTEAESLTSLITTSLFRLVMSVIVADKKVRIVEQRIHLP